MSSLIITDDPKTMVEIGKQIVKEKNEIYSFSFLNNMRSIINEFMKTATIAEREEALYRSIYDYWVYGNTLEEEFFFGFRNMSHSEKETYVTAHRMIQFVDYLNPKEERFLLDDKYALFSFIPKSFQRDMIKLSTEKDKNKFFDFIEQHEEFVIKPVDIGCGKGVRKAKKPISKANMEKMFYLLLEEGKRNQYAQYSRGDSGIILEELIEQAEEMSVVHPESVNVVRMNAFRIGEDIVIFHPWVKFGSDGKFVAAATTNGCCALIDMETGQLSSLGYDERCNQFEAHPNSGVMIKGFQIPEWKELYKFTVSLSKQIKSLNYIGWDMAYSTKGWCVVEANSKAGFAWQRMLHRGVRPELERLIGWQIPDGFWWE